VVPFAIGKKKARKEEDFISFRVEWISDIEELKSKWKEIKKEIREKCPIGGYCCKVIEKLYVYLVVSEVDEVLVTVKGKVYVGKVDVLGSGVIFLCFLEGEEEEYGDRIIELIGSSLPEEEVDFKEVNKVFLKFRFEQEKRKLILLGVFLSLLIASGIVAKFLIFSKPKVKKVRRKKEDVTLFKPYEKDIARFFTIKECMEGMRKKFRIYSSDVGFIVKKVEGVFTEDSRSFSCNFRIEKEYLYPAKNSFKRGKIYYGIDTFSYVLKRQDFLQKKAVWQGWGVVPNYKMCVLTLLRSGFIVTKRSGGQVEFEVQRLFNRGNYITDFFRFIEEVDRVCKGKLEVKRLAFNSVSKGIEVKGLFVLHWDNDKGRVGK